MYYSQGQRRITWKSINLRLLILNNLKFEAKHNQDLCCLSMFNFYKILATDIGSFVFKRFWNGFQHILVPWEIITIILQRNEKLMFSIILKWENGVQLNLINGLGAPRKLIHTLECRTILNRVHPTPYDGGCSLHLKEITILCRHNDF